MAYEDITYEVILQRMLDRVPNNMDKREGSIIFDALAPAAVELQLMYIELDTILKETFADTAQRDYLVRRAAERGIEPYEATYATLKGIFTPSSLEIPIGSRFSCNELNYVITSKIQDGEYQLQCETLGVDGNANFGDLIPIDYIQGLETAKLTELLIPGEDEEDVESLRERYFASFETKPYGGNKKDYIQKTNAIAGVGSTKVTPIWQGGGTVLLTILNSEYSKASNALIKAVQEEIDPTQDGTGMGIAPIGHIVTVQTVEEVPINVKATFGFDEGYSFNSLKSTIQNVISEYLLDLRKNWANQISTVVRISQIETKILQIEGIIDIQNTKINGSTSNLTLTEYQVPIFGGVNQ
jgi:uncharacterized phage protein gp47/JayE|nr:MAG TPA: Baseplate J like protein [Caudoviricetes sp.]